MLADGDRIGISHGRPPTTGIIKAPIPHVAESVVNEAFCQALAAHADLEAASVVPRAAGSREYLLVHRYDRGGESPDGRIHQEDFCQALGLVPAIKYEKEGGPSAADCAALIRRSFSAPARDLTAFLDALLFNFVIANHDAHSKNYSLLFDASGSIRLAPLYDLMSTAAFHETDRKLAMRFGSENRPEYVRGRHLDQLASDLGVKPALVRRRAIAMRERTEAAIEGARNSLPAEFQDRPMVDAVVQLLTERGEELSRRAVEAIAPADGMPERDSEKELDRVSAAAVQGLQILGKDFDSAVELIARAAGEMQAMADPGEVSARWERLATDLEDPAQRIKEHGRELYDAVAEFDSVVDDLLSAFVKSGGPSPELVRDLEALAEEAGEGLVKLEQLYSEIKSMEETWPVFRVPVRRMRSGLRDMLEARRFITGWGERARSAVPV